ncbi:hypothetical protein H7Y21_03725 [Arenimonas sp.]|nr:hypothetical protein [Candidatus Parcubacteria bacterium]
MQESNGSSSNLIIGIILGILIIGGVFLYMRNQAPASKGSADINVTLPTTQDNTNGR